MIPNFEQLFKEEEAKRLAKQAAKRQAAKEKKRKWQRIDRAAKKLRQEAMTSEKDDKAALLEAYHKSKDTERLGIQALVDRYKYEEQTNKEEDAARQQKREEDDAARQQKREHDDAVRKRRRETNTLKFEQKLEKMEAKDEEKLLALFKAFGGVSGNVPAAEAPRPDSEVTPQKDRSVTPRRTVAGTPSVARAGLPLLSPIGEASPKNLFGIGKAAESIRSSPIQKIYVVHVPSIMKEKVQSFCIDDLTGVEDVMMVGDTGVALVDGRLVAFTAPKLGTLWDTPPKPRPIELEGIQNPITAIYRGCNGLGKDIFIAQAGPDLHVFRRKSKGVFEEIQGAAIRLPLATDVAISKDLVSVLEKEDMEDQRGGTALRVIRFDLRTILGQDQEGGKPLAGGDAAWGDHTIVPFNSRSRVDGQLLVTDATTALFAVDNAGNQKLFKVPEDGVIDYRRRWKFNNTDLACAACTQTLFVVSHKTEGLFYSADDQWYPMALKSTKGGAKTLTEDPYDLVGGDDLVLASQGSQLAFLKPTFTKPKKETTEKDEEDVAFVFSNIDFQLNSSGEATVVAMDASKEWAIVLVEEDQATPPKVAKANPPDEGL